MLCCECKRELKENEEYMDYNNGFIKCKSCHIAEPTLKNFQECEIYSRCVGYIRPIKNFNPGKTEEFHDRKTYKIK